MPSNASYMGSAQFTSQNKSPGHISSADALEANDIAQLVNDKATTKFPKADVPQMPDIQQPGLTSAPGELVGRGENKVHRPSPFGNIDAVKAASIFKKALYDVNVDTINTTSQAPSLTYPSRVPDGLDKMINKAPRLGDYAADAPVGDGRTYGTPPFGNVNFANKEPNKEPNKDRSGMTPQNYGAISSNNQRKQDDSISSKYQADASGALKVALAIPEPIISEDDWQHPNGDDDYADTSHISKQVNHTGNLSHVGVAKGIGSRGDSPPKKKKKEGTFVSFFLRSAYE